jgi:hypothetical protein
MHPYEQLSLFTVGIILAVCLIGGHALMLAKPAMVQGYLKKFPRDQMAGQILLGIGLVWFWLLIAPENMGKLSALAMDLGEFNGAKRILRVLVPVTLVLVVISVRDFLAVRALGVVGLMLASPLLEAAFLEDPASRILVPAYAYLVLTASMFCVGMPYLFRDAVTWVTADQKRWTALSAGGLVYGLLTLACALVFWRGH